MTKKTFYIAAIQSTYDSEPKYTVDNCDMTHFHASSEYTKFYKLLEVREIDMPEMPSAAEINGIEIDSLETKKSEIQSEARAKVKAIEERIANLRCIEHMEAEA